MSDATKKNFQIIQNVMNDQAKALRDLIDRVSLLEGEVATLRADIQNTKQLAAHLNGRGMGSTVHN
jgi:uncharacterized protein (UPF0335 family)